MRAENAEPRNLSGAGNNLLPLPALHKGASLIALEVRKFCESPVQEFIPDSLYVKKILRIQQRGHLLANPPVNLGGAG